MVIGHWSQPAEQYIIRINKKKYSNKTLDWHCLTHVIAFVWQADNLHAELFVFVKRKLPTVVHHVDFNTLGRCNMEGPPINDIFSYFTPPSITLKRQCIPLGRAFNEVLIPFAIEVKRRSYDEFRFRVDRLCKNTLNLTLRSLFHPVINFLSSLICAIYEVEVNDFVVVNFLTNCQELWSNRIALLRQEIFPMIMSIDE